MFFSHENLGPSPLLPVSWRHARSYDVTSAQPRFHIPTLVPVSTATDWTPLCLVPMFDRARSNSTRSQTPDGQTKNTECHVTHIRLCHWSIKKILQSDWSGCQIASLNYYTQRFKNCFHRIVGNECLLDSGYPCHAIVYIPMADFGQYVWETQATAGDLKPFAQRYFLTF